MPPGGCHCENREYQMGRHHKVKIREQLLLTRGEGGELEVGLLGGVPHHIPRGPTISRK